jgi:hypothetical protein
MAVYQVHTYMLLTLYPWRGRRGISDIPPRYPHYLAIRNSAEVTGGKSIVFWWQTIRYIHTCYSRFIPEGVAEASQIFLRDTHITKLSEIVQSWQVVSPSSSDRSLSGVSAVNLIISCESLTQNGNIVKYKYYKTPMSSALRKRLFSRFHIVCGKLLRRLYRRED